MWTSPAGCLMFTALRQLQVTGTQAPFINYVVCLAVVQGIKEATRHVIEVSTGGRPMCSSSQFVAFQ